MHQEEKTISKSDEKESTDESGELTPGTSKESKEEAPTSKRKKRQKKDDKKRPTKDKTTGVKNLREKCVEKLNDLIKKELGSTLPENYTNFLIDNEQNKFGKEDLNIDPICIFSFQTPKDEKYVNPVVESEIERYKSLSYAFPTDKVGIGQGKIQAPFCIASYSEIYDNDNDNDETMVRYYIDLKFDHRSIPLKVHRVRNNALESIHVYSMNDFIKYCKEQSPRLLDSIGHIESKSSKT
ncbi:hypothetical protein ACRRVB_04825 [Candidatus Cardinium hertigii]|uniref:hypothetical protein n=1 Tax=Candidatus Cardinium hertigii TaxID=247481 RepID=UPI003D7E1982